MTFRDIELQKSAYNNLIADKFKEMQIASNQLKYAEDKGKNTQILVKMKDAIEEVYRCYSKLEELELEIPEEENDDNGFGSGFGGGYF